MGRFCPFFEFSNVKDLLNYRYTDKMSNDIIANDKTASDKMSKDKTANDKMSNATKCLMDKMYNAQNV